MNWHLATNAHSVEMPTFEKKIKYETNKFPKY